MIRIQRIGLPPEVEERLVRKAAELARTLQEGEIPSDTVLEAYKHVSVKAVIKKETHGKCAYCESMIDHVYFGDVEHILPKEAFPERRLDYTNLTYVCAICNNGKSDYYSDDDPLVNPFLDEPADHLIAFGPLILGFPSSAKGVATVRLIQLNRPELVNRRIDRIRSLHNLAQVYASKGDGRQKEILQGELIEECGVAREFTLVMRSYLSAVVGISPDDLE